jgi:hypothetical protein
MPVIVDHPRLGAFIGGNPYAAVYNHPLWAATAAGVIAAQQASTSAIAMQQAMANATIAQQAALAQQAVTAASVKPAIDAHLATASQILATPTPTTVDTSAAALHIAAARQLLPSA